MLREEAEIYGPAECGSNQVRADGCQLRSGRGSRANNSSKNRSKAGRWSASSSILNTTKDFSAEGTQIATLKVGRGLGTESPDVRSKTERSRFSESSSLLDSNRHNCNTLRRPRAGRHCGAWTLVGAVDGKYVYVRFRCKSYACPRCGPRKGRLVRNRIAALAVEHRLQRLVTLTLDPKKLPPNLDQKETVEYLRNCWRSMRVYLSRKLGRSAVFICVLEFQKNGNPHLHVLVDAYLPHEWLLHSWQSLGGGFTDIRFVDLHRVAAYLSKYMTKAWLEDFPPQCRRLTASRGLVFFVKNDAIGEWCLFRQTIDWFFERATKRGVGIEIEQHTEKDGVTELGFFIAADRIAWTAPQFMRTTKQREGAFLRRTGRRTVPGRLRYSPRTSSIEVQSESVVYL